MSENPRIVKKHDILTEINFNMVKKMNILTFDVEEWFHVLDHGSTKGEKEWDNFEYRLDKNLDKILEVLDKHKQKATFFCIGWLSKHHKHIIKKIDSLGYEIASHSNLHQLVYEQYIPEFNKDLERSIKSLEEITGKKVKAYRAPGFSVKEENRWFFDSLCKQGIEIDCSIFPAERAHGGFANYTHTEPSIIYSNNNSLKEFPISLVDMFNKKIVVAGGGYFRLCPYPLLKYCLKNSQYNMTYFHPHDFDENRPLIGDLSWSRKFKAYVGLKGAIAKLDRMIKQFDFVDLSEADSLVDWQNVPKIYLKERRKFQRLTKVGI